MAEFTGTAHGMRPSNIQGTRRHELKDRAEPKFWRTAPCSPMQQNTRFGYLRDGSGADRRGVSPQEFLQPTHPAGDLTGAWMPTASAVLLPSIRSGPIRSGPATGPRDATVP